MLAGIAILVLQLAVPNHYKTLYKQELLFSGTTISSFKTKYYHNRHLYACAFIAGFGLLFLVKSLSGYALEKISTKSLL